MYGQVYDAMYDYAYRNYITSIKYYDINKSTVHTILETGTRFPWVFLQCIVKYFSGRTFGVLDMSTGPCMITRDLLQVTRNKKVQLVRGIDHEAVVRREEEEEVNDKRIRIIFAVVGDTHVVTQFVQERVDSFTKINGITAVELVSVLIAENVVTVAGISDEPMTVSITYQDASTDKIISRMLTYGEVISF
jgi:hypothetical protein